MQGPATSKIIGKRAKSEERYKAIRSLLELSASLEAIADGLHRFNWDYENEPVEFRRVHLVGALHRYVSGELSAENIERWANLVEGRDDISFAGTDDAWLAEVIYELANPFLTTPLNMERARELIASIGQPLR